MKHGPNALIDETLPVVCIATQDPNSALKYMAITSRWRDLTPNKSAFMVPSMHSFLHQNCCSLCVIAGERGVCP
jgi:glutamine---fructose-6-phosphate transaminase (isomerizing)